MPGTHPVSWNISLASFRRAISFFSYCLAHDYLSGIGGRRSYDRRSHSALSAVRKIRLDYMPVQVEVVNRSGGLKDGRNFVVGQLDHAATSGSVT